LTPEQVKTYTNAFKKFDTEGRGRMAQGDLQTLLRSIGFNVENQQAAEMIAVADSNNTGTIEQYEFLELMIGALRNKNTKHEFARKFQIYDRNNDGYITKNNILQVTEALGTPLYPDQIDALIKQADKNKDGRISYKEYVSLMVDGEGINKYW
jgi:Ca2+-binding EF-hand superfamily protein